MVKVSRGKLFSITLTVDESHLKAMKKAPEFVNTVLTDAAFWWHTNVLPEHFTRAAHGNYGYAERGRRYLRTKGQNPDLVRSGAMKRELLSKAAAKAKSKNSVELKLTARALNFVPNGGNQLAVEIERKDGHMYPNMKREIVGFTAKEEKEIATMIETRLAVLFQQPQ